ncbi:Cytochrome c554 and c-prime [Tistlia consotensis]|uniref:Cytochrome c554 and c-prime n=1 Tax=Tistlia consotensis USBA 355 TaxID=560819 RepID=A0A1Y6CKD6_9PROT|nr:cytochrome c family protein [Tistlia consotensis]SMF72594.1 Cytochrome c554 and c-prime [Tistlia consotensis USBA 355]SNS09479.1 Cytochrome c554 and c-prime [Tistlia consotensis]
MSKRSKQNSIRWFRTAVGTPLLLVAAALLTGSLLAPAAAQAQVERDPAKVVGPGECAECHKDTAAIWRHTHHFATFREMPQSKKGIEIAQKMGLRRIKEGSLCLDCHFTTQIKDGEREPIAGISCESCHGAGRDYLKVHSKFSGKKEGEETKAEIAERWRKSEAGGMIRPYMMYRWAKNCYSCHVVPQEKLVNLGGHTAGSAFELVAWSQGEVRHNVWYNKGKSNPPADLNQRRKMFVVGMAVELETALRAVGAATEKATYAITMAKRADIARKRFRQATQLIGGGVPEMASIVKAADGAALKLNNKAQLDAAADAIGKATQALVNKYDGGGFGGIDRALPPESQWKGTPEK